MRSLLAAALLAQAAPSTPVEVAAAPAAWKEPLARASKAARALQDRLQGRLARALSDGGPAAAVSVCRDEARQLALAVERESGVQLGRTSDRLRNPANAPPAWAKRAVAGAAGLKASAVAPTALDLGDRLGVLFPIPVRGTCVGCHGPPESLPVSVKQALEAAYPGDRATGYAEGELRGFVWVEVPR
ncbi:MAG TPA: DUF3365 domain-containing protein [Anaeromyxobacteraceae bacterium]|nr:DUF3365 domain-containing protein [Anaeromyxobacteraceae bacterium]